MSAPDTNIENQKAKHRPALLGIGLAVGVASLLLTGFLVYIVDTASAPGSDAVQIDGVPVDTE